MTPWAYTKHVGTVLKGTPLQGVTVQSFRHSHASQLIAANVNIKTVSERLGHSSITITLDTYGHMLPGMDENAAEAMELNLKNFS
ncbi:MAG: tyrosine-type recombinase/integrase [Proteobacteria bacterium]|nr:tyrosine-type recombinase/integrase [Pseudomonadota bacterium]